MRTRSSQLILCLLVAIGASGCISMRPYAEVAAALPAESLLEIDGRRVHVDDRGEGEPLLLLHGFGASTLLWEPVIDELAATRRVVAIDLNGFGWSERPRNAEAYTLEGQERLVLGVADAMGFERFDLGGHSYGGAISIFLTSRHPERVRSLLLVDSAMPAYAALRRNDRYASRNLAWIHIRTVGLTAKKVRSGLLAVYADKQKVTDELVAGYLGRLRIEGVVDAFHGLTAPNGEPPVEVDLGELTPPTLLVWGAEDALVSAAAGRAVGDELPDARFVEIPGCGHSPMEECPQEFVAAVAPFLATRP
jgi:pimeloyl-ACP methyl ester carboxylesterase